MSRISVVLFLLSTLLWLGMTDHPASANDILPQCSDVENSVSVMAGRSTFLHVFEKPMRSLSLDCFSSEVYSVRGGQSSKERDIDHCISDFGMGYDYKIFVHAMYKDEGGTQQTQSFPIQDISDGSLTGVTFRMPVLSKFHIVFTSLSTDNSCILGLHASFDYTENPSAEDEINLPTPALVAVRPHIAYTQKKDKTVFVFQFPKNITEKYLVSSLVKLVSLQDSCDEASPANYMDYVPELPDSFTPPNPSERYHARGYQFQVPGSYRICFQANGESKGHELGIVMVLGSNPGYFELYTEGSGTIYTYTPIYFKFSGSYLDTRDKGDVVKLVEENGSCKSDAPADGVSSNTRLLPINKYGPNVTSTVWRATIKKSGTYKACYKRRGEEWVEVPNKFVALSEFGPTANSTPAVFPIPIDPATNESCPTAPTDGTPWVAYSSLQFNMKKGVQVEVFANMIVNLFCVPRSAFTIIRMTHDKVGRPIVFVAFACSGIKLHNGRPACDNIERSNYAVFLSQQKSTLLSDNGIDQILGSTSIAIPGDDPELSGRARSVWVTLIICATVVACSGMLVYAVLKYRQRRQYFVQFGMDDDSLDDMYASGMVPAGMDGSPHPDVSQQLSQYHHATSGENNSTKVAS